MELGFRPHLVFQANKDTGYSKRPGGTVEKVNGVHSAVTKRSWDDGSKHITIVHKNDNGAPDTFSWDVTPDGKGSNPHQNNAGEAPVSNGWSWKK